MVVARDETGVAVSHPQDLLYSVVIMQSHDQGPDNIVYPGTETPAGNNGGGTIRGRKEKFGPGAGFFKRERSPSGGGIIKPVLKIYLFQDPLPLPHVIDHAIAPHPGEMERRVYPALP